MPHITEEIWHILTQNEDRALATEAYPEVNELLSKSDRETNTLIDPDLETQFTLLIGSIRTIRNLRAEADIKAGVKAPVILQTESEAERQILQAGGAYIRDLAKVEELTITPTLVEEPKQAIAGVVATVQVLIPLSGIVDITALRAKLEKNLTKLEAEVKSLAARLNNPNFVSKAPPQVVQNVKDALAEAEIQVQILRERLERLQ
jgi:valyl-tRNA synthetase